ncbi:MAG TPA: NUDIX domain-containing protein, partial [Candidatus Limnocylindrales bacterium]|nr:NUDIX domain-containing protein [Candidatus Limnocylindrales bacterium]
CGTPTETRVVGRHPVSVCPGCERIFFRNPKVVVVALIEEHDRVLLVRRDIEPGRGLWGLPGGYVDWDEHPERAMVRECLEETGVEVEPGGLLGIQHILLEDGEGAIVLSYRARLIAGEPAARDETQEVAWFPPRALPPLAFQSHRTILQSWAKEVQARGVA